MPQSGGRRIRYLACQKEREAARKRVAVANFAFPNDTRAPASLGQLLQVAPISFDVPGDFCSPIVSVRPRWARATFASVAVPKATVNKDDAPPTREDYVGFPRKVLAVEAEAKPLAVQQKADHSLGSGILAFNGPHYPTTLGTGHLIFLACAKT
jgi:hypothetical protein